ncbi:hypothetical protein AAIH23_39610, partial [Pseudomonas aeruginosa]
FFNVTKYPPSLLFLALTLGIGLLLLAWFERLDWSGRGKALVAFGGAPMFFYLLHLYLLKLLYLLALAIWGANRRLWRVMSAPLNSNPRSLSRAGAFNRR